VSLRKRRDSRNYSAGNIGKWLVIGTELPIMVIAGVYIGNYLGKQFGAPVSTYAPIIGAFLGLLAGTYFILKIVRLWESRQIPERIDKKMNKKETPSPSPPSVELKALPGEVQKKEKASKLSEDEKLERVIKLMKLQVNLEDDEASSSKNDKEPDE
jgi:hypothetical protein